MRPAILQASWVCPHYAQDSVLCDTCRYMRQLAYVDYVNQLEDDLYIADAFLIELGAELVEVKAELEICKGF